MFLSGEMLLRSQECYFGVYKHQNNPLVNPETVGHSSTYIILLYVPGADGQAHLWDSTSRPFSFSHEV